jgi:glycosyltransferase involved in cell wall biosynthesis
VKLLVVSHKECWPCQSSPSGYATRGGFPFQIRAIAELFDATTLVLPLRRSDPPPGLVALTGYNLKVSPVGEPAGQGWRRKLALLAWLPRYLPRIWRAMGQADAVHAPVPGDLGALALLMALGHRKRLFVRHCGTWGHRATLADRFLMWLLPRIAGGRTVVMATGGADRPPVPGRPEIQWIFSSTLTGQELADLPPARPWRRGEPLRLAAVARLDPGKNVEAALRALPLIRAHYPATTLEIAGEGPCRAALEQLAARLGVLPAVSFLGNLSHQAVMEVMLRSHVFLFPTRVAEGFPKAVLEALACGLAVAATEVSVIPELLGGGRGVLLRNPTSEALAAAVVELIADESRLAAMAQSGRALAQRYTLERWQELIAERLTESWGSLRITGTGTEFPGRIPT